MRRSEADPAELAAALVAIGLLKRSFTAAELAAKAEQAAGRELHRSELAHLSADAADMQLLMAAGAAADLLWARVGHHHGLGRNVVLTAWCSPVITCRSLREGTPTFARSRQLASIHPIYPKGHMNCM